MTRLRPEYWMLAFILSLAAHLAVYLYATSHPGREPVYRGGSMFGRHGAPSPSAVGVYVRLGNSAKTSGDKPGQAALKELTPAERPRESPAQSVVAGQDKKGSGTKETEPPKPPKPVARRVPKKTGRTAAKEEEKPKTEIATPAPPTRKPRPPNLMPETARRAEGPKPPPANAARPRARTGAGGSKGAEKTTSTLSFGSGGGRVGTTSGSRTGKVRELNYVDQVLHWLKAYGTYPREARMFGLEDTVTLKFAINRQGKILYYTLVKESEWLLLNMAVRQMMDRASRVPPIPPEIANNEMTFTVPVEFSLRPRP